MIIKRRLRKVREQDEAQGHCGLVTARPPPPRAKGKQAGGITELPLPGMLPCLPPASPGSFSATIPKPLCLSSSLNTEASGRSSQGRSGHPHPFIPPCPDAPWAHSPSWDPTSPGPLPALPWEDEILTRFIHTTLTPPPQSLGETGV